MAFTVENDPERRPLAFSARRTIPDLPRISVGALPLSSAHSLAGLSIFACFGLYAWWLQAPCDDAYIYLVYVRNFLEGNGLTFNGLVVEGFTSVIWMMLLVLVSLSGLDPVSGSIALSFAAASFALWLVYRCGRSCGLSPTGSLFAVALTAASGDFAFYATSGLEAHLLAAVALLLAMQVLRPHETPVLGGYALAGLAALAVLVRPDGILLAGSAALYRLWCERRAARFAQFAVQVAVLLMPIFLARWVIYEQWMPNTFYVKASFSFQSLRQAALYLYANAPSYGLLLLVIGYLVVTGRRAAWEVLRTLGGPFAFLLGTALVYIGVFLMSGGDHMVGFRIGVAVWPLVAIALVGLGERVLTSRGIRLAPAMVAACLALVLGYHLNSYVLRQASNWRIAYDSRYTAGILLDRHLGKDATIAVRAAGISSYHARRRTIDLLGLNNQVIAREGDVDSKLRVGHQVGHPHYVQAQQPDVILPEDIKHDVTMRTLVQDQAFMAQYETFDVPINAFVRCGHARNASLCAALRGAKG